MKLYPQNLRDRQHARLIRRRSYGVYGPNTPEYYSLDGEPPPPRLGKLGRLWSKGVELTPRQAATALPAASMQTQGMLWLGPVLTPLLSGVASAALAKAGIVSAGEAWGIVGGLTGASLLPSVFWLPRAGLRSLYKRPLVLGEIDALQPEARDDLERAHLDLLRDAIQQEVPEDLEPELRAAIEALGQAIDRLPAVAITPLDTEALRREADALLAEARAEPDPVTAASLERRADALQRRAEANDRSRLLARRSGALRAEIVAQIAALREGIGAFGTQAGDAGSLAHLSESARRVATEASSVAAAREELDAFRPAPAAAPPPVELRGERR